MPSRLKKKTAILGGIPSTGSHTYSVTYFKTYGKTQKLRYNA